MGQRDRRLKANRSENQTRMDVKTFRAESMQAALALVRRELGPQASVLGSREVRGGLWGWLSGPRSIEVTASTQVSVPSRLPPQPRPSHAKTQLAMQAARGLDLTSDESLTRRTHSDEFSSCDIRDDDGEAQIIGSESWLYARMFAAGIDQASAGRLARDLSAGAILSPHAFPAEAQQAIIHAIESRIAIAEPLESRTAGSIVAFVGATGVGKTTTVAKLAASLRMQHKRTVGLISADSMRLHAADQLRACAGILDMPLESAGNPDEMRQAIGRLSDCEIILVDTAGCNPRDESKLTELDSLVLAAGAAEVWLVASCTSSSAGLLSAAERFGSLGASATVLTKLDEADSLAPVLPMAVLGRLAISYLSDGQRVPDDIAAPTANQLARLMVQALC